MEELEQRIHHDGHILSEDILKVDSFINHQVDPQLMDHIGQTFADHFADQGVTKVLSIESSGIAPALLTAQHLGVPMVFARKTKSLTMNEELISAEITSFTKQITYQITVSEKFIKPEDKLIIIDDFLATGSAAKGLIEIVQNAGATVAGVGILIEKNFQFGREVIEDLGVSVTSLARIDAFENGEVVFGKADA